MSDMSVVNEDAVRAYAGKVPLEVVDDCIRNKRDITDVERAYCSQYFTEQFALIDADEAVLESMQYDPAFEGLDMSKPLPAYAQERKDMYDSIDTDFARRTSDLLQEYYEAIDHIRENELVPGRMSSKPLVDEETMRMLRDNGLSYSTTRPGDVEINSLNIVDMAVKDGNHKLCWDDSYVCDNCVHNKFGDYGFYRDGSGNPVGFESPEAEADAKRRFEDEVLKSARDAQAVINDKTPAGVRPYSVLSYPTVEELHAYGFDYNIKGYSAEGLLDIKALSPLEMVKCAEEADIKWDSSMQKRMDDWILYQTSNDGWVEPKVIMSEVHEAERFAGASQSNVFDANVAEGVFHNGSKVRLYGTESLERLKDIGYEAYTEQSFDDYLSQMRERHVPDKEQSSEMTLREAVDSVKEYMAEKQRKMYEGVSSDNNREIKGAPEFSGNGSGSDGMSL